jgi:flagellar basal-body rod modification protein FlgD
MNALVAVRSNATGLNNVSREKRAETAKEIASSSNAKTLAALEKAGVVTKATDSTETRTVNKELDRDAFLQLLTLQMQNQDPMSPIDNTQMVAQLAQFSSLEQMNALNTSFTGLKTEMDHLNFLSTNTLIGRTIIGADTDGNAVQGKVEKVVMLDGAVSVLAAGKTVPVGSILQVE